MARIVKSNSSAGVVRLGPMGCSDLGETPDLVRVFAMARSKEDDHVHTQ